ncbi:MAG TPA: IPTL-CTERM sorting domain-containing protein [Casimicrobiaceae bacterium]|jgi:hypothetical protein|nr:IPTL-CTERM sorting domain-containing protein [Casimicrobiaceae bacterium]
MSRFAPLVAWTALSSAPALAQFNAANFLQSIPTLDEFGLGALIALVAGVAGWAIRRSKRK